MSGGSLSNSYTSMENVYRGTTMPHPKLSNPSFMDALRKMLSLKSSVVKKLDPLLDNDAPDKTIIINRQDESGVSPRMPLSEEAALLSTIPSISMDDIELRSIQLQFPNSRRLSGDVVCHETRVRTDRGEILVAVQGERSKPAIITYHDLGLNYISSFQTFFNYIDMRALLQNFCVYHVNAPGQEEGAAPLPDDYVYPSMDELANQLNYVLGHFGIKTFVGFGVGAGANIMARYALHYPQKMTAVTLINCTSTQAGWIEWGYQKLNSRYLRNRGMTQAVLDYLMWHHFGRGTEERSLDLMQVYRLYFTRSVNPANLSLFIDSYVRRSDLSINRDRKTIKVPVLNITGSLSPHVDDTVTFNGRLNPSNSTWMKISDCGMVLEEQPTKISEAFRLFLQGEGYAVIQLQRLVWKSSRSSLSNISIHQ